MIWFVGGKTQLSVFNHISKSVAFILLSNSKFIKPDSALLCFSDLQPINPLLIQKLLLNAKNQDTPLTQLILIFFFFFVII